MVCGRGLLGAASRGVELRVGSGKVRVRGDIISRWASEETVRRC